MNIRYIYIYSAILKQFPCIPLHPKAELSKNIIYIYIYIYIYTYSFEAKVFQFDIKCWPELDSNPQPCAYCVHALNNWAIWPNDETCFILILNFPKCFRQNHIRQSFPSSLTYQKIPRQDQLVLSAANSFKLMI